MQSKLREGNGEGWEGGMAGGDHVSRVVYTFIMTHFNMVSFVLFPS